ncbi:Uncharacterised protein [Mycobacterium tuberculosis]|nr:Uncharacterised protein [Mycobacterium tuberculosis]CNM81489.1 Uncharacterised protein [Mycobacterium tuberculosis]CPA69629.1 Uncharacterised protein [Mycobacterium tuberculosis]
MSRSRGCSAAARIAGSVISWKTIRFTGMRGLRVSSRCQAIASPSRSPSVARYSSSTSLSRPLSSLTVLRFSGLMM